MCAREACAHLRHGHNDFFAKMSEPRLDRLLLSPVCPSQRDVDQTWPNLNGGAPGTDQIQSPPSSASARLRNRSLSKLRASQPAILRISR